MASLNAIDDQLEDVVSVVDAFYADVLVMPMSAEPGLVGAVDGLVRSA